MQMEGPKTTNNTSLSESDNAGVVRKQLTEPSVQSSDRPVVRRPSLLGRLQPQHSRVHLIENFVLVWLDWRILEFNDEFLDSINRLRTIINSIQTFTNFERCIDFITQNNNEHIYLIVSGVLGQQCVPKIHAMTELDSIYIFCTHKSVNEQWAKNWWKVKGIFTAIESLCDALRRDVHRCERNLTPISIISNELNQSFMYSRLLKEILLEIEHDVEQAKKELADFCRTQYAENENQLQIIDEFERNYDHLSSIRWYTRDCFIYSMVNKALRVQDIGIIIKMGFFIRDLHREIERVHSQSENQHLLTVYRGQGMTNVDFEVMNKKKGGLLSFNNFLSTNIDQQISLKFAQRARNNPNLIGILFQIDIDPTISSISFASLDNVSWFSDSENEILFSMQTVFRIDELTEIENRLWQVNLTSISDTDEQITRLTEHLRIITRGPTGWHRLGALMIEMNEHDKAENIYKTLLESTNESDWEQLAHLHHQLGYIDFEKRDLTRTLYHYKRSLDIKLAHLKPDDPGLSGTFCNIGEIHRQKGDLSDALEYFEKALAIDLRAPKPQLLNIATFHNNIGLVLDALGKYSEALKSYERALEIYKEHLPPNNPSLATTYSNIGFVHYSLKDYTAALSYYEKSLLIRQKYYPSNHPTLGVTHKNMAHVLEALHRYEEAIEHAKKAVDIARYACGPNHTDVIEKQVYLENIREKM